MGSGADKIAIVSQLPLSPVGKVLRRAVRELCLQRLQT